MWGKNAKAELYGSNRDAAQWAERTAAELRYPRRIRSVLVYVASKLDGLWCEFRDCIARIMKATDYSRSSVCEALAVLRKDRVISYDGQVHVGRERPVAKYRLESTPDFPVPQDVSERREQAWVEAHEQDPEWEPGYDVYAGQDPNRTKNLQSVGYVGNNRFSETPLGDISQEELRVNIYPPALPGKKEPEARPEPLGDARRVPHLGPSSAPNRRTTRRVARDVAKRLLGVAVPRKVGGAGGTREKASPAVCQPGNDLPVEGKIAVTYSPRTTEGAAMTPFTDPALGALPLDTRYFYLGLLDLHNKYGDRTPSDEMFLWAELFRYDNNVTQQDITRMKQQLIKTGKIHQVSGDIVLSDPPGAVADDALFTIPTAPTPLKQNPEQDFDTFWHYYPRRIGKGAARKAFLAAVSKGTPAHRIIEAAASYANTCQMIGKEIQFTPYPSVWLNQERWDDDQEQAPQVRSHADDAFRQNMRMVEHYRQQELGGGAPKEIGPSW